MIELLERPEGMNEIKLLMPTVFLKNGVAYMDHACTKLFPEKEGNAAIFYGNHDADGLCILEFFTTDEEHDENINVMKKWIRNADLPVYVGGVVRRFEDIKKYFYTGAQKVLILQQEEMREGTLLEASNRFGKDKLILVLSKEQIEDCLTEQPVSAYYLEHADQTSIDWMETHTQLPIIASCEQMEHGLELLSHTSVCVMSGECVGLLGVDCSEWKKQAMRTGILVKTSEGKLRWSDLKKNSDEMVPVVVQDYQSDEVLMLAYMNEEAFGETLRTGKMTYYSRSRKELWKKGMTSGHIQYVKSLTADCDMDTILAKVYQIGAACHTGNHSCFFHEIIKKEYENYSPTKVLHDVYEVILNRKEHPKKGSYTNYLFDKGVDKILKKVGEEATEIVIAAKNPDPEEIRYEMADFLYHAMVLMVEKGITWEDITRELANR